MFAIDKAAFGVFLAERRREKGFTQKELAEKLFVSDKAVSKWERGLSLPDVSLLIPLAETLGVTVAELLVGRSLDTGAELDAEQVDKLVKKAITLSGDSPEKKKLRPDHLIRSQMFIYSDLLCSAVISRVPCGACGSG